GASLEANCYSGQSTMTYRARKIALPGRPSQSRKWLLGSVLRNIVTSVSSSRPSPSNCSSCAATTMPGESMPVDGGGGAGWACGPDAAHEVIHQVATSPGEAVMNAEQPWRPCFGGGQVACPRQPPIEDLARIVNAAGTGSATCPGSSRTSHRSARSCR